MTTLEQIRATLSPYLYEHTGLVDIPANLISLLEDADENARSVAELIEGILALYAVKTISPDTMKERLRDLLKETTPVPTAPATSVAAQMGQQGFAVQGRVSGVLTPLGPFQMQTESAGNALWPWFQPDALNAWPEAAGNTTSLAYAVFYNPGIQYAVVVGGSASRQQALLEPRLLFEEPKPEASYRVELTAA